MNAWDLIIVALIILSVGLALRSMWRARRRSGGCGCCPYAGSCGKSEGCDARRG